MKLLSIDVGIKNLAFCLFDKNPDQTRSILLWDIVNLCGKDNLCTCNKPAKYEVEQLSPENVKYFCIKCAKKSDYIIPTTNLSYKIIKKMKLHELNLLISKYNIPTKADDSKKRDDVLKNVIFFMKTKLLQPVNKSSANQLDLVSIGISLMKSFDTIFKDHLETIECIVIENQISPIANRMKTLQGMLAQYFIMHNKTKIVFVSSANKLKGHLNANEIDTNEIDTNAIDTNAIDTNAIDTNAIEIVDTVDTKNKKTTYADRKKEGVRITLNLLQDNYIQWLPHFTKNKKKDDLADAFLQGNWYLNKK